MPSCTKKTEIAKTVIATFQVKEIVYTIGVDDEPLYDTDSVSTNGISFEANEPEANGITYSWKIGTDVRNFTTRKVALDFFRCPTNEIEVTLTVTKTALDSTKKTVSSSRKVYLRKPSIIPGIYRGVFHHRNGDDSATVKIQQNFCFPGYDELYKPYYKGTLISSTYAYYDTIFIAGQLHPQVFLNKKFIMNSPLATMPLSIINRNTNEHVGYVSCLSSDINLMKMEINAEDTKTSAPVKIFFEGKKIN